MTDARLKGLSEDGTHLLLISEAGEELRLPISDELRGLVRHARVIRSAEPTATSSLTPREIQQRIRAGLNAAELAHITGEPVEALAKFEAPVLAERAYIVQLAQGTRVGADTTAPSLVDLVGDRLASRGVDPTEVVWDAWRDVDEPWKVAADFRIAGRSVRALWTFDHVAKSLTAEDEESAWLTETELMEAPIPRRHLSAVRAEIEPLEPHRPAPVAPPQDQAPVTDDDAVESGTDDLLEDLAARRGTREQVEFDDDEDDDDHFEGFGPARAASRREPSPQRGVPGRESSPERPASGEQRTMPHPQGQRQAQPAKEPQPGKSRKGRASVPSWDEIVFGARHD